MTMAPVDPSFALDAANASDMVQKKMSIDAMRKRVGGNESEDKKLREACEGFESIFLQKMWEQMRKNVQKEGYLHSKDEESYQSMFDTELAKKMTAAGGIGLADMLYEQLGQKLANSSKTTGAGSLRTPISIEPPRATPEVSAAPASSSTSSAPDNLYADIAEHDQERVVNPLQEALSNIAASRDPALDPANAQYPMFDLRTGAPMNPVAEQMKNQGTPKREFTPTPLPERVSSPAKAKPSNAVGGVGRSSRHARKKVDRVAPPEQARAVSGQQTQPLAPSTSGDASVAAPVSSPAASLPSPAAPGTGWSPEGQQVSFFEKKARSLQENDRSSWTRIA